MKLSKRWLLAGLVAFFGTVNISNATHIRAGEITVERISCQSRAFLITITGWVDKESTVEFGGGELDFGDGSEPINLRQIANLIRDDNLGNNLGVVQFQIEHTYGANGNYTISYLEANRNAGILNMNNSVETTFYIETQISIDPFLGCNNTPIMLIPPIDEACPGATFFHNPGAFDSDGDSISYELTIPKRDEGTDVSNYRFPNVAEGGATEAGEVPPIFEIDPVTGDITWDAPFAVGEYNLAFIITEWRRIGDDVLPMSRIVRDMQIIVIDCDNERPRLEIPDDLCVEAGTFIEEVIEGRDPDDDQVQIEAFGGPFEVENSPAVFIPTPPRYQPQPAYDTIQWQTNCFHVRTQPYQVTFKILDNPDEGPRLVGFEPWNITVVAPAPEGVGLTVNTNRTMNLTWDEYFCQNARTIQVWRRVDSFDFESEECLVGIPENAGYELIAELDPSATNFLDENRINPQTGLPQIDPNSTNFTKQFLDFGANYCYRLVADFPDPAGGTSYASIEVCGIIIADAPVITNVTVDETDEDEGQITVKWRKPFEIDSALFPPPYSYDLYRVEALSPFLAASSDDLTPILVAQAKAQNDTVHIDTGINTISKEHYYYLELFDSNGTFIRNSSRASQVDLNPKSLFKQIDLDWRADVPWSNRTQDHPYHYIYRDHITNDPNEIVLIDSVDVNEFGFNYLDIGQSNDQELDERTIYCYFIQTQGSHGNPKIERPLINFSQIVCAQPSDTIPPCAPRVQIVTQDCESFLEDKPCGFNDFENRLIWFRDEETCVAEVIAGYRLYFNTTGPNLDDFPSEPLEFIQTSSDSVVYLHENLSSFAGCYYITTVDQSGNESAPSEIICNDNCPNYVLPNVFTPNGDGVNDLYKALNVDDDSDLLSTQCPRFVEDVFFRVYNRYGREVYTYRASTADTDRGFDPILIGWDGISNDGQQLAAGVYYYVAELDFVAIAPELKNQTINGWLQILR